MTSLLHHYCCGFLFFEQKLLRSTIYRKMNCSHKHLAQVRLHFSKEERVLRNAASASSIRIKKEATSKD